MAILATWRSFARNLFRRTRVERALDDEVRGYLDLLVEEKVAAGLPPEAARRAARVELGGTEQVKEQVRSVRAGALVEQLGQDARYAVRTLRRTPGFTIVAIVTLALGIGANTAIFSIVDALLFRPLPIADPARVVALYRGAAGSSRASSYLDYLDYRAQAAHVDGVAAWGGGNRAWFRTSGDLQRVDTQIVSGNYFDVLGVRAAAGRTFFADEDDLAAPRAVAVISDRLWRTEFDADPHVAGRLFTLGGQRFTVAGVAPRGFKGLALDNPPDVWLPFGALTLLEPGWNIRDRHEVWVQVVARLRAGSDIREAQASLQPVAARLARDMPAGDATASVRLLPASQSVSDPDARASSFRIASLLMAVVGLVLLIACANVANLVLARGAARARELGVRLAIGATRGRVVRQVVTESIVLALAGGAASVFVARWTAGLLVALAPAAAIPPGVDVSLDSRVIAFAIALSLATGVTFGIAPAWQLASLELLSVIKGGDRSDGRRTAATRLRRVMVVAQVALSVLLLVGAALFVRTLSAARAVPSGFDAGKVLLLTFDFSATKAEPPASLAMANRLIERVSSVPGVESASFGQIVPFSGSFIQRPAVREGLTEGDDDAVPYNVVGADYFRTLGMPLRGRDFNAADDERAPRVVVINETLARRLWPGEEAIGKRLQLPLRNPGPPYDVIGVVSDGKYVSLTETQHPFLYLPLAQNFRPRLTLHVRTTGAPAAFSAQVRDAVRGVSPDLPTYNPTTLETHRERSLARERLIAWLLTAFSGIALAIAAVGIYGMLAYAVARRTRELGVRLALGARPSDLVWMVVRQSAALIAMGLAAGVGGALALTRLVATFLYGVTPTDLPAFASAVLILSAVALVATSVPARRATRVDPLTALRSE